MARRVDVVERHQQFSDADCRYSWNWSWVDCDLDYLFGNQTVNLKHRRWIRKIPKPGHAYCVLCQIELNYANKGISSLNGHKVWITRR